MANAHHNPEYLKNRGVVLHEQPVCTVCNRMPSTQVDHIIPIDAGGGHEPTNLRGICTKCNNTLAHRYVSARNELRRTVRAEAMRGTGVIDITNETNKTKQNKTEKTKPFFYEQTKSTPTQLRIIPDDPNQRGLAVTGRDEPRLETVVPDDALSFGAEVGGWALQHLGIEFMPWQQRVIDRQLMFGVDGDFLHRISLVSTARQNGKTVALTALVGWWLTEMPKHREAPQTVLTTAHRLDLAVMLYDRLADILKLRFGATCRASYGRNSVTMPDGSLWFVRAANNSVGHGMSCDLIVADEIWDIGTSVIDGGLLPSQRARRSPLLSCWSTAGTEASTAMQRWREQGLRAIDRKEPSSLYFAEWSPPPDISPMDAQAWGWANPALGTTLTLKTIEAEAENPDRAAFLRASCNLWVASDKSWIQPGLWPELEYTEPMPEGGTVAIETSMTDDRYFATRAIVLEDRRTVVTVEFVCDTYSEMLTHVERLAKNSAVKFAISPSIDIHWPLALERRRAVVGYGEILKFTPRIKSMINEKLLWHTGETMLAEHVQRAVAVRSQNSIALSSQRSPGPIELARCLVWSAALASRPTSSGKPMVVVASR